LRVAAELGTWSALGIGAILFLVMTAPILVLLLALMSSATDRTIEGAVHDVQQFVELTARAREQLPSGLPLLDPAKGAEAAAAISRFKTHKDEARRALWASSNRNEQIFGDRFDPSVDE
jgi:hypothetical protein